MFKIFDQKHYRCMRVDKSYLMSGLNKMNRLQYCNKTMNSKTQTISHFALQHIFLSLKQQLKINALLKIMPEYLAQSLVLTSFQIGFVQAYPSPKMHLIGNQDHGANNPALDAIANFRIQCEQPTEQNNDAVASQQLPDKFNKSIRKRRQNSVLEDKKQRKVQLFALSEPIIPQKEIQLEKDLQAVRRNLYLMRKLRKQNEDEQNRRLQQSFNRKVPELPSTDFTFDVSGQLLPRKPLFFKKHLASPAIARSQDVTATAEKQKYLNNQTNYSDREFLISRGRNTSPSRELNRVLFGNQGKRQVSHLPFIKLNQNIKLCQGPRSFKGPDSQRYTLKSYQSRAESNFKSYSQIQKDKSDRLYSLKRSSRQTQLMDDQVELKQEEILTSSKKQSKRMQKYLKKLCEDKTKSFVVQINRTSNFDRLNSPHDYTVHRYYKHNFNDDKRSICELSLASLKLQNSRLFHQSTQLS